MGWRKLDEEHRAVLEKQREALEKQQAAFEKRRAAFEERRAAGTSAAPRVPPELFQRAERIGRRRRLIALAVVAAIGLAVLLFWSVGWDVPTRQMLRGEDAFLPFQYLIMALLIHRLWQLGNKFLRWLFPDPKAPPGQRGGIGERGRPGE